MKFKMKFRRSKIKYVIEINKKDVANAQWPKKELELLSRKNASDKISDKIYALQVQARVIETTEGFVAKIKGKTKVKRGKKIV